MGSSSSLISGWMLGPIALESMLIQVNTVASTCIVFCLLHIEDESERKMWMDGKYLSQQVYHKVLQSKIRVKSTFKSPLIKQAPMDLLKH